MAVEQAKLIQIFKDLGLHQKEADIYLNLLAIGTNPASIVAKKAGSNRSSCYAILERLLEKGFVEKIIQNKVTYFHAVDPQFLLDNFKRKHHDLETTIDRFQNTLHDLAQLKDPYNGKSKVVFYQGAAGIQNIMEDTLTAHETIRAYASLDELTKLLPNYFPHYYSRRTSKGIHVKAIYPATKESIKHQKMDKYQLRESRLVPKEFDFHLDILIYDNKVAITSFKEKFGVLIESKDIADAQKRMFDLMWEYAKKYENKIDQV